jgi:hypothetical protein
MTAQEIFSKAWHGLASQGWICSREASLRCAYRGERGSKCAVGWLIADTAYSTRIESISVGYASSDYVRCGRYSDRGTALREALLLSGVDVDTHLELLGAMQTAHDRAAGTCAVKNHLIAGMREVAGKFGLSIPEETQ